MKCSLVVVIINDYKTQILHNLLHNAHFTLMQSVVNNNDYESIINTWASYSQLLTTYTQSSKGCFSATVWGLVCAHNGALQFSASQPLCQVSRHHSNIMLNKQHGSPDRGFISRSPPSLTCVRKRQQEVKSYNSRGECWSGALDSFNNISQHQPVRKHSYSP